MMSLTHIATCHSGLNPFSQLATEIRKTAVHRDWSHTRSMPTVSWIPVSKASFSFVPTPSALAAR